MLEILRTRRSVRRFLPDPVAAADLRELLAAAMQAPSAGNEQAWQFVVMDGAPLEEYYRIVHNCPPGAPAGILVCGDLDAELHDGYHERDCAAATQNLLLAAHALGLGAVWTAVFPSVSDAVSRLAGLPPHLVPFAFVPVGRPAETPHPEPRYAPAKAHRNRWGTPFGE